ncbi:MAG: 6-pyruvoyl tetrahydrobiopterin synthase [Deltaproteobacteria bacterium]|nr:6-pyruvoyl tetrahydrobiopterin synthase [Deltaproteobacteria bacterium]
MSFIHRGVHLVLRVTRTIHFSTSLRYWLDDLTEEENRKRFGREADKHGHNYRLDITVAGEPDPQTGMVINLVELKQVAEREIMSRFDHKDLNGDTDYFVSIPPTPEHFATLIFRLLQDALPEGLLDRIRLHASHDLYVDVIGPVE